MSAIRPRHRVWPFCLWLCAFSVSTLAAEPTLTSPGDQDLIRGRQDRLLDEQRRRLQDLQELPGKAAPIEPSAPAADSRCFQIDSIEVRGAEHLTASARERLSGRFMHQCLGVSQLNDLLKAFTDHYIERGLVTSRAYLPAQDLSSGHLLIQVVEGHLEGLQSAPGSGLRSRELAMTFPGRTGEVLNLRDIEQLVDQLNRLPSHQATMELTPGSSVGSSTVQVNDAPQKPWRASLSRNNNGQKSTGEQQWGVGLDWDSPLGLADQLNLRANHDAQSDSARGSDNAMFNYNLPWGWWNINYSYSQSHYQSVAQGLNGTFGLSGNSQTHQLSAERVIYRDALSKTSLSAGIAHMRTENYVATALLDGSSPRITEAQFGINHGRRVGDAFVNLDLGLQQGIGALDAQSGRDPGPGKPTARYRKYTATASYLLPFRLWDEAFTFTSLATGQHSEDVLYSAQRMSIGGQSSVRGFKDGYLTGDTGGYWRNELRWSRPVTWDWMRPAFAEYGASVAYDQGVISSTRYAGDQHGRISGNAVDLFARGRNLLMGVTFAHSLERTAGLERESPIYFHIDLTI
ncbi:MAG: ShlB/FhaC/HecB family hemolysin secretion/activation protein [Janthinobacterium lividum]